MTVKQALSVLADVKEVRLGYDSTTVPFDYEDKVMVDAFGRYAVEAIYAIGEDRFEIDIAMRPVVEE